MIYLNSGWALGSFFSFFSSHLISPFIGIILESRAEKGSPGGGIRRFSPSSPSSSSSRCFIRAFIPDPPVHRQNIRIHPGSSYSQTKYQNSSQILLFIEKILKFIPDPPIHRKNIRIHPRSSYSQTKYQNSSQILLFIDKILECITDPPIRISQILLFIDKILGCIPDPPVHRQNIRIYPRSYYSQTKYQNSSQILLFKDKILEFIPDPPIHRKNIRIHPKSSYSQTKYQNSSRILLFIDKILEFIADLQNNSKKLFKQQIYLYILKSSLSRRLCFLKYM